MDSWVQMRVAAGIFLALYAGIAAVISGRELRFLNGLESKYRSLFLAQDILIQLAILSVLLPCAITPQRSKIALLISLTGFMVLWVVALWAVFSRSMYTYRLMLGHRGDRADFEAQLRAAGESEMRRDASPSSGNVPTAETREDG